MNKEVIVTALAGATMIAKKASRNLKDKSSEYIKEKILQNEFVTREEYNQLRQLVIKLSEEIKTIDKKLH